MITTTPAPPDPQATAPAPAMTALARAALENGVSAEDVRAYLAAQRRNT